MRLVLDTAGDAIEWGGVPPTVRDAVVPGFGVDFTRHSALLLAAEVGGRYEASPPDDVGGQGVAPIDNSPTARTTTKWKFIPRYTTSFVMTEALFCC